MSASFLRARLLPHLITGLLLLLLPAAGWSQGVPPLLNYQGRVVVGSTNFSGKGLFKFALVNAGGTTTYWSNDGTSNAGGEPTAAVSLPVTGGLYSLALGDTSLPNMTALPASVFAANADVRLRVWFNDGTAGSQQLTPDQRITSVGYAQLAATVPDGAITSAKIGAGAVGAGNLAGGTAGTYQPVSGATATQANTSYAATGSAPVNFTLPSTAKVGDVVTISGAGAGGYSLTPGQGQSVFANGKLAFNWTAAPGTNLQNSPNLWKAVACSADGSHIIVCRSSPPGAVRISTDYGASFTAVNTLPDQYFVGVAASADFTHLVVAANSLSSSEGGIYVSNDAGATWTAAANTKAIRWSAVACSASGARLVATVSTGGIYTSADFGVTWTATNAPKLPWSTVASSADGTRSIAALNDIGRLYLSTDAGLTWTATGAPEALWHSVATSANGFRLAAVGQFGNKNLIYLSADGGATWTLVRDVSGSVVASSADGVHLAALAFDHAYTSSDGGASWTSTPTYAEDGFSAVASSADGVHLVGTASSNSIHTATGTFTGAQGSETQFQYLGNGQWGTLNQAALAAGSVGNTQLANSSLTINTTNGLVGGGPVALGGALTLGVNAASANTASALVTRDSSGNFSAGTITANLSGNAATATNATNAGAFTGALTGDVTGTQGATIVKRASGSFSAAGAITAVGASTGGNVVLDGEGANLQGTGLRLGNTSAGARTWDLFSSASNNGEGAGKFLLYDETAGVSRLVVDNTGRVGIGQVPTTNTLEVNGNASKSTAGSWLANSDARIKTGIHPLTGALAALDRLNPVGFHYTPEYRAAHPEIADVEYQNVIAQEFREVFPDAVKGSGEHLADGSEILQVDTYPALIESLAAIKELHARVTQQEAGLERLRREATQKAAADEARFQRMDNAIKSLNKTSLGEGF